MPEFKYEAIDELGLMTRGELTALDREDLDRRLLDRGLTALKIVKQTALFASLGGGGSIKPRMLIELFHRLGQSLAMGIPIITAITELADMLPSRALQSTLHELRATIQGGATLGEAMEKYPAVFDRLCVGLVKMGELTGELPRALSDLAAFLEWKEDIRSTIRRATIYPSFILISMGATVGVWIGYVLPQMADLLEEMGVELPDVTLMLLTTSRFCQARWLEMLVAALLAVGLSAAAVSTRSGRLAFDRNLLKVPVVGEIAMGIVVARLSHNFSTAYSAGMTVLQILEMLGGDDLLGNRHLEARLKEVSDRVQQGQSLSQALELANAFPNMMVGAVRAGEMVGVLDQAFTRLGAYYDGEVKRSVETLIGLLEPLTIMVLGGLFGLIILSILLPLYDVLGQAGNSY